MDKLYCDGPEVEGREAPLTVSCVLGVAGHFPGRNPMALLEPNWLVISG